MANDYEMMNQRVDQLRIQLADVAKEQLILDRSKEAIMAELLDTHRQITRVDKKKVKMGWFYEGYSKTFRGDAFHHMLRLSTYISDIKWNDESGAGFQSVQWMGIPKAMAPVDYLDV